MRLPTLCPRMTLAHSLAGGGYYTGPRHSAPRLQPGAEWPADRARW